MRQRYSRASNILRRLYILGIQRRYFKSNEGFPCISTPMLQAYSSSPETLWQREILRVHLGHFFLHRWALKSVSLKAERRIREVRVCVSVYRHVTKRYIRALRPGDRQSALALYIICKHPYNLRGLSEIPTEASFFSRVNMHAYHCCIRES